jgi:DNA-binding GntR family transcriptional regulator
MTLSRKSLGAQIASDLAKAILSGEISQGQVLVQEKLCERYETSRIPVRDALLSLQQRGFLVSNGSNQLQVATFDRDDLSDLFDLSADIMAKLARRSAERAKESDFGLLAKLHDQMLAASAEANASHMSRLNFMFHGAISRSAQSSRLRSAMELFAYYDAEFYIDQPELMDKGNREHAGILAALMNRDAERSGALMRAHIRDAEASKYLDR